MAIRSDIYFQNQTPDIFGQFVRGKDAGEKADERKRLQERREGVQNAFNMALVTDDKGNVTLDDQKLLQGLAQAAPDEYMNYADTLAKQKLAAERAKMNEALNIGRINELTQKGYLQGRKMDLEEQKFASQKQFNYDKLIASQKQKGFEPVYGADGTIKDWKRIKGWGSGKSKTFKKSQYQAAGFARRAEQAEEALQALKKSGFDPSGVVDQLIGDYTPDFLEGFKPGDVKAYEQAKRNFVSAVLRDESGAAIPPEEQAEEQKKYFPRAGDDERTLAQKRQARIQAIKNLKAQAGGAYDQVNDVPMSGAFNFDMSKFTGKTKTPKGKKPSWAE